MFLTSIHQAPQPPHFGRRRSTPNAGPRVAVLDYYHKKAHDIDGDDIPDLSHGDLVERYLRAELPNAQIIRLGIQEPEGYQAIRHRLQQVLKQCQDPKKRFDALNVSLATYYPLASLPGISDRLRQTKVFHSGFLDLRNRHLTPIIHQLEQISQGGTPVFVAAGNEGKSEFNAFGLAQGVTNVGASKLDGTGVSDHSADNELIHQYLPDTFVIRKTKDGFDINGDGKTEVADHEVSGDRDLKPGELASIVWGTSLATPIALARHLKQNATFAEH